MSAIVLGLVLVDFNHLVGPTIEYAYPEEVRSALKEDENLSRILPFLALPDGAHLSEEDYSYFHCQFRVGDGPIPINQTVFGISCNRQIAAADLDYRPSDVTRSVVQKAVVVLVSQPLFGPIRDQLGVVTRAFFAQRDFSKTEILEELYDSLIESLRVKADETALLMRTDLRGLVHKFRHRTLVLLKMLMLQNKIMMYGYPVETLCVYQYSLVSLMPGLLASLQTAGSPSLGRTDKADRPTSFRSNDRQSSLRVMGLPLDIFGKEAFFQPYLPLQEVDQLAAPSWLVGTTNQIVTQQRTGHWDLLVDISQNTFEFADPLLERATALTPQDRRWMDEIVKTVDATFHLPEQERSSFHGSDDDLRLRFEQYIQAALSAVKLADFHATCRNGDLTVSGIGIDDPLGPFSSLWLERFRSTRAYSSWSASTDPVLFDLFEPKHPCEGPVNLVADLGLRFTEGLHDLKFPDQFAPARQAVSSAFSTGSATIMKAFEGRVSAEADSNSRQSGLESARTALNGLGSGVGSFFASASSRWNRSR